MGHSLVRISEIYCFFFFFTHCNKDFLATRPRLVIRYAIIVWSFIAFDGVISIHGAIVSNSMSKALVSHNSLFVGNLLTLCLIVSSADSLCN